MRRGEEGREEAMDATEAMEATDAIDAIDAMERVLGGLGSVEVPPGLERRVMLALEDGAELPAGSRVGWLGGLPWLRGGRRFALASVVVAVASVVVAMAVGGVVVGGVAFVRHGVERRAVTRVGTRSLPDGSPVAEAPVAGAPVRGEVRWPEAAAGRDVPVPAEGRSRWRERVHVRSPGKVGSVRSVDLPGEDGAEPAGNRVRREASFPAPPLPVTEQERLLLRVVHRGDTQELAMLNPVVRAEEQAAEARQIKEFFKDPKPLAANPPLTGPAGEVIEEKR